VLAVCLLQLSTVAARPKAGHSASSSSSFDDVPVVLQTYPAAHLDLALVPCKSHDCAIQVRLFEADHVVDRLTLPITARLLAVKAEAVDESWGADPGLKAWRSGFESDYVSTTGRLVTVAPGVTGLLVSQRHNFEPMKHEHLLVLARRGKLRLAWRSEEGASTWSATQVIRGAAAGTQDIAYLQTSRNSDGISDHFEATRLRWDAAASKLQPTPLPDADLPLYVLSLGKFDSTASAREARTNFSFCMASYWVLDGSAFPGHAPALVGKVFTRRATAEDAVHQVKTCLPDQKPAIVPWAGAPQSPPRQSDSPAQGSSKKL
jgi:hypothetical protein